MGKSTEKTLAELGMTKTGFMQKWRTGEMDYTEENNQLATLLSFDGMSLDQMLSALAVFYFNGQHDEYEALRVKILSYYQPRPEGSVTATRDEYDTLTEIAMLIYHFQNDLRGAIPEPELTKLKTWLAKWYEALPEGE